MSLTEITGKLRAVRDQHSRIIARASRWIKGVLITVGALISGVCQFLTWPAGSSPPAADIAGIAASMAVFFGGIYVLVTEESAADAIRVAERAVEEAELAMAQQAELENYFSEFGRLVETYQLCLNLRGAIEQSAVGATTLDALVASMFDLVSRSLAIAAGFQQADRWTVGVYKAEPSSEPNKAQLRCIAHKRAIECSVGEARIWPEGVGIAGIAYANKREIILPDLRAEGMKAVFGPSGLQRDYDDDRHVSMAAVPIIVAGRDKAWGVINATSDRSGHFSAAGAPGIKTDEPVRSLAAFVGLAVAMWDGIERSKKSVGLSLYR